LSINRMSTIPFSWSIRAAGLRPRWREPALPRRRQCWRYGCA